MSANRSTPVLAQTFSDLELIVIDDCSADSSVQEVIQISNPTAGALLRHSVNSGPSRSRNDVSRHPEGNSSPFATPMTFAGRKTEAGGDTPAKPAPIAAWPTAMPK